MNSYRVEYWNTRTWIQLVPFNASAKAGEPMFDFNEKLTRTQAYDRASEFLSFDKTRGVRVVEEKPNGEREG